MLESILDTGVKIKIAKFLSEREDYLQVSDIARILGVSKSRASECLRELAEVGIVEKKVIGRSVIYRMAQTNIAKMVRKTLTQEKNLLSKIEKSVVSEVKDVKPISLVLYGSALKGLKLGRDIDFLLIYRKNFKQKKIYEIVGKLSEKYGIHVSILSLSEKEFKDKAKRGEEFILNILASYKLVYGKKLEEIVW